MLVGVCLSLLLSHVASGDGNLVAAWLLAIDLAGPRPYSWLSTLQNSPVMSTTYRQRHLDA
jgi:hypothetical protein